jgi:plasmid stabilization system protein ParE
VKLRYLQAALDDIDRLHAFLAEKNPEAAAAAARKIRDAAQSLIEASPERGTPIGRIGFRQLFVQFGRSAYVIRYRTDVVRDELVIVRIWHGRERRN